MLDAQRARCRCNCCKKHRIEANNLFRCPEDESHIAFVCKRLGLKREVEDFIKKSQSMRYHESCLYYITSFIKMRYRKPENPPDDLIP